MALIPIRERTSAEPEGTNATISFDNGPLYNVTVNDPFSEQQEEQHALRRFLTALVGGKTLVLLT